MSRLGKARAKGPMKRLPDIVATVAANPSHAIDDDEIFDVFVVVVDDEDDEDEDARMTGREADQQLAIPESAAPPTVTSINDQFITSLFNPLKYPNRSS